MNRLEDDFDKMLKERSIETGSKVGQKNLIEQAQELLNTRIAQDKMADGNISNEDIINNIPDDELNKFKDSVSKYSEIEKYITLLSQKTEPIKNSLKPIQEQIKLLKTEKVQVERNIINFMKTYTLEKCNLPNSRPGDTKGAIKCATTLVKTPMTEKLIKERISLYFTNIENNQNKKTLFNSLSNDQKADDLYNFIYKEVPKTAKDVVRKVTYAQIFDTASKDLN